MAITLSPDTTPSITTATPAGGTYTSAQSVTLSCDDGGGSGCAYTYYCFGASCSPTTPYADAIMISASTSLRFYSIDASGNVETIKTETYVVTAGVTYTITTTAGPNGSITPTGTLTVPAGGNASFTMSPDAGYMVQRVLVDGVYTGGMTSYTFTNVTSNHTIDVSFMPITYTITASAGTGGGITPGGASTYLQGVSQTFTITPTAGYHIADVLVDGTSVGAVTTYPFTNITANHSIVAAFAANPSYTITATPGPYGSITPAGDVPVPGGASQRFTITPASGYRVADVLVDGVSAGAVTMYNFTNVQASHTIIATFTPDVYTITATAGPNGTISPAGETTVNKGESLTYIINPAAGYTVQRVRVDGAYKGNMTSYIFTNVTANHRIDVSFMPITYTITASAGAGGSITPGTTTLNSGGSQTYTITPTAGYHITDVLVDGISQGAVATYPFSNITANHTIAATFAANAPYPITASAGSNGSITPAGVVPVPGGTSQRFTITPASGYRVLDVLVDGASKGAVTTYNFTNVQASHTISATFTPDVYIITATAGPNGTISPAGETTVNKGGSQTYTITPDPGYTVQRVRVDGAYKGNMTSYTFTNVTGNHTIDVSFMPM